MQTATTSTSPTREIPVPGKAAPADPRADLLRALERPAAERNRAVRLAMNAWLAADGAAAITAARDDPDLGDVANRMTQLALFAYPEMFVDNPALLEDIPDRNQSIAMVQAPLQCLIPTRRAG